MSWLGPLAAALVLLAVLNLGRLVQAWRWARSWRLVRVPREPLERLADQRVLQLLLYAARPSDRALWRIWGEREPDEAARALLEELGVQVSERITHAEYDSRLDHAAIERSVRAFFKEAFFKERS